MNRVLGKGSSSSSSLIPRRNDCPAAIPLGTMASPRILDLCDLMDGANGADQIRNHGTPLGRVRIIDANPPFGNTQADVATDDQSTAPPVSGSPRWPASPSVSWTRRRQAHSTAPCNRVMAKCLNPRGFKRHLCLLKARCERLDRQSVSLSLGRWTVASNGQNRRRSGSSFR